MKTTAVSTLILVFAAVAVLVMSAYTVDETEQVVITRFGKVIGEPTTDAGLHFKLPFVDQVSPFPKNLQQWDGESGEIPTLNKTYILVNTFARWQVVDPVLFFQTCRDVRGGLIRIGDIIDPAVKNAIASYDLIETVRNSSRLENVDDLVLKAVSEQYETNQTIKAGRSVITRQIMANAGEKLKGFGINLVDVKIKRLNYRDDVRNSVYDRMIAERTQIVEKFRSEGRGEAQKIKGEMEKELKKIESEAYRTAQELKGKADAEVTSIYADAYGRDPEFYSFTKSLEVYGTALNKESTLVLSTDSEFLKYLKERR
ncbi:protease modulator HflC [Desulfoluna butyratoxydans]|uniref:Protein HflC n=1 Tax=Desulfoluna butyratoxydans TaxID=231438 RepID=A0A4U8YH95_9BACT|nr:protease modulator HflC [Desulfoluna butyratoxydans]VFQ42905.1 hflc [Desulfoluna butyratoxydans]